MNEKQQEYILNSIANNLSLLNRLNRGTFKLTESHFTKENQQVLKDLKKLQESGFKSTNTDSFKLIGSQFTVKKLEEREAEINFKNALYAFEQSEANKEINKTKAKIEEIAQKLANEGEIQEKEELIKQIAQLSLNHKKMINKNNAKTTLEITRNLKYDENKGVIPTFINHVDLHINGGFERNNISVISATPHNGKTTFGVETASNQAMEGFRVLYLSLEQIQENINQSVLSYVSESVKHQPDEVKKSIFNTKNPKEKHDKKYWDHSRFKDWKETNEKKELGLKILEETVMDFLSIEDTTFNGVNEILERINLAAEEGYDIVYIDNFQNLKYDGERTQSFEKFSEGLLDIAKETGLAIVALSQLTTDKNGSVKTKYASKLNDDASNHLKITRVKKEEEDAETPDMVEIYVEKTRRGSGFNETMLLPFLGDKGVIGYVHIPNRTPEQNRKRKDEFATRKLLGGFYTKEGLL